MPTALDHDVREVDTPDGIARISLSPPGKIGLFVVGHGAGGGIDALDILAVASALHEAGWTIARVTQPYRVKGHRAPPRPPVLDEAWCAVLASLAKDPAAKTWGPKLVVSGRSSGARVAVRTASEVGADGVVALAFPLHPPGRPDKSRADELKTLKLPTLIVQGQRDAFGTLAEFPKRMSGVSRVEVLGDHSLKQGVDQAAAAVVKWVGKTLS